MKASASGFIEMLVICASDVTEAKPKAATVRMITWTDMESVCAVLLIIDIFLKRYRRVTTQIEICRRALHRFIKSRTAAVIRWTPVRMVGSGRGANRGEWRKGSGTPVRLLS